MNRSEPQIVMRRARHDDLAAIVRLLADDALGATRERFASPLPAGYARAFAAIDADPNNELVVADCDGQVVGVLQLTFIPYLTYQGSWRALIEGVRIDSRLRGQGVGARLLCRAMERAPGAVASFSSPPTNRAAKRGASTSVSVSSPRMKA